MHAYKLGWQILHGDSHDSWLVSYKGKIKSYAVLHVTIKNKGWLGGWREKGRGRGHGFESLPLTKDNKLTININRQKKNY